MYRYAWGLLEGVHIGLPPVLNFGNKDLRERVGLRVLKVRLCKLNLVDESS
jgi:hypothetical protein